MFRKTVVAAMAIAATVSLAACGNDSATPKTTTTTSSASANASSAPIAELPTAQQLNDSLQKLLDPSVPNDQKVPLVQGSEKDPSLFDKLIPAVQQTQAKFVIVDPITDNGDGTITANGNVTVNGQTSVATVPFVYNEVAKLWSVQNSWVCNLLSVQNVSTPACSPAK